LNETARVRRAVLLGLIRSILGWADRKGTSDCADEVTLSRKGAKSRTRITGLRSTRTKARTHVDRLRAANADLKRKLTDALEQQTATSEMLRVISSSPGELGPIFDAMLENATRICEAKFGTLYLREGDTFRAAALMMARRYQDQYTWQASRRLEIAIPLRWFAELPIGGVPSHTSARARSRHNRDRYSRRR